MQPCGNTPPLDDELDELEDDDELPPVDDVLEELLDDEELDDDEEEEELEEDDDVDDEVPPQATRAAKNTLKQLARKTSIKLSNSEKSISIFSAGKTNPA